MGVGTTSVVQFELNTDLHREFEPSLSDGASDDDMPLTLPTEGSHSGSIRKVRHLDQRAHAGGVWVWRDSWVAL